MLVPGVIFVTDAVDITTGPGITPDFINQGFGFMNSGALAVDVSAPSGNFFVKGFRMNASGAVFGVLAPATVAAYIEGIPITSEGQLIFDVAATVTFSSRNPITAAGNFSAV
jgi:hypothetical protein